MKAIKCKKIVKKNTNTKLTEKEKIMEEKEYGLVLAGGGTKGARRS